MKKIKKAKRRAKKRKVSVAMPLTGPASLRSKPVIGYSADARQTGALMAWGLTEDEIWQEGLRAETFALMMTKFRNGKGTLVIAGLGRVFGDKRAEVNAKGIIIEEHGVKIFDFVNHTLKTNAAILADQNSRITGSRRLRDRRHAKKLGAKGGTAKHQAHLLRLAGVANDIVISRVCECAKLNWSDVAAIFEGFISRQYLQKHFGN